MGQKVRILAIAGSLRTAASIKKFVQYGAERLVKRRRLLPKKLVVPVPVFRQIPPGLV